MAELLTVDARHPDRDTIARAAACLRAGGLVAFPTETVYGLGAHALDAVAVRRIFEAKGRPASDPLIVHVGDVADLAPLVHEVPPIVHALAARFWPGPLTLVLRRAAVVPPEVTAGGETVAVRVPSHPVARALLAAAGVPIAAPSANLFSRPSPTQAAHVAHDLGDRVDLIVDGGSTTIGVESTVLDLTSVPPVVLRPGGVSLEALREVVPDVRVRQVEADEGDTQVSPGLLLRHYSPRTPLTLVDGHDLVARIAAEARARLSTDVRRLVVLASSGVLAGVRSALASAPAPGEAVGHAGRLTFVDLGPDADLDALAAGLYARLREADALGADLILAGQVPGDAGIALAVRDRLHRAAAGRVLIG